MMKLEEMAYLRMVKSTVTSFDTFLNDVDKDEIVLSDEPLIFSLRKISKTLQRIVTKWDRFRETSGPQKTVRPAEDPGSKQKHFSALDFNYNGVNLLETGQKSVELVIKKEPKESIPATKCSTPESKTSLIEKILKSAKAHCQDTDDESDSFEEPYSTTVGNSSPICEKKLELDNTSSEVDDVIKKGGIEEITNDVSRCIICNVGSLPKNNVASHTNGKQHQNNLRLMKNKQARDSSMTRIDTDINSVISDVDPALTRGQNGEQFITIGACYSCSLCKVDLNSAFNLVQHLEGSRHKKLCGTAYNEIVFDSK